ncbi:unnamed protein product [Moneuplotes crassus]|uniref:Uncharacterized protein n=1 Tax=Euplotes crassus TaxID=5936 RepID=A0AAD2D0T1_EUPCR|nr:unnamed protein product [Moneuplotes crassus]
MEDLEQEENFLGEDERKNGVTYTEYVDLLPFEERTKDDHYCEALRYSSSDDWKEQFFATDLLRRLNKYEPELIGEKSMEIFPFLDYCINSPRTCLGKNVLIFCQEIYMSDRPESLVEFTCSLLPFIITKIGFESTFLSTESQFALQFCAASMAYPQCIDVLCAHSDYKNNFIKNKVWEALTICIQNLDPSYYTSEVNYPNLHCLETFLETICKALVVSKSAEAKESTKMLKFIGKETVQTLCDQIFDEDNKHKVERVMGIFAKKAKRSRFLKNKFKNLGGNKSKGDFVICIK